METPALNLRTDPGDPVVGSKEEKEILLHNFDTVLSWCLVADSRSLASHRGGTALFHRLAEKEGVQIFGDVIGDSNECACLATDALFPIP